MRRVVKAPAELADARLLSLDEVAAILGIKRRSAKEWAQRGYLPVIKVGRLYFAPVGRLNDWLARTAKGGSRCA